MAECEDMCAWRGNAYSGCGRLEARAVTGRAAVSGPCAPVPQRALALPSFALLGQCTLLQLSSAPLCTLQLRLDLTCTVFDGVGDW